MLRTLLNYFDYFLVPKGLHAARLQDVIHTLTAGQREALLRRVRYYNKLTRPVPIHDATTVDNYAFPLFKRKRHTTYFLDLYETLRYFPPQSSFRYLFGDVTSVPVEPSFVKSRPIDENNQNSVLLKLNKRRHFRFVKDKLSFAQKKDMLVSRTSWAKASSQRTLLNSLFLYHPMCNVGKTTTEENEDFPESVKGFLTIPQQLEYKFIACIEGTDVATNLKWVMSSNSVAVMPQPHFETWYMEGTLKADYHYIEVQQDFSDLIDKIKFYGSHPEEAQAIIHHAHEHIAQFRDKTVERVAQLLVAQKYFEMTKPALL